MSSSLLQRITARSRDTLRRATASYYSRVPLRTWPKVVGLLHAISVPTRVHAYAAPTPTSPSNINILLDLLDRAESVAGAVAECGVFQGSTLVAMALHVRQSGVNRAIYGFDSFEGFGASIHADLALRRTLVDPMMKPSGFSNTSVELVARKLRVFGLSNVKLVKGFFENTLASCSETTFSFVHLDCDTYAAYRDCLEFFYPRLAPGAIVVFDEYNDAAWPGCNKAVDEFLSGKPETLVDICRDNFIKTYFVKE